MQIRCHTNLDLEVADKCGFPTDLPAVPRVGDYIESSMQWPKRGRLRLKVVSVTWEYLSNSQSSWTPVVELHVPPPYKSITEFYELYYSKLTGKHVGAYI